MTGEEKHKGEADEEDRLQTDEDRDEVLTDMSQGPREEIGTNKRRRKKLRHPRSQERQGRLRREELRSKSARNQTRSARSK